MKGTILVTGGAGYIGSHLVRLLIEAGYLVRVVDADLYTSPTVAWLRTTRGCSFLPGDIRHIEDMAPAVRGVDAVIDLAAIVGDEACEKDRDAAETINMHATELLLRLCQRYGVKRLIFASTCSVYGAKQDDWLDETSSTSPLSLYAETKLESEKILLGSRLPGPEVTVLRLATIFGLSPRMRFDLVLNFFAARAASGKFLVVHGGEQVRPLLHARDAANAFLRTLQAPSNGLQGQIFNAGCDEQNLTIAQLAALVAQTVPGTQIDGKPSERDLRNYKVRFDKIARILGYKTHVSIQQGTKEIVSAIRSGEIPDYLDDRYYNVRYAYKSN